MVVKKNVGIKMVVLLLLLLLNLFAFYTSCFATNLTGNEFRELLKNNEIEISDSTTIPSDLTTALNKNPVILTSPDKTKVYVYEASPNLESGYTAYPVFGYVTVDNVTFWTFGFSNDKNLRSYKNGYYLGSTAVNNYCVTFDVATQTFSKSIYWQYSTARFYYNWNDFNFFKYIYDSNSITETDFKTLKTGKNAFLDNLLFSGVNNIYYGENNLLYKFDGVFKGNGTQEPYTSNFKINNDMYRFEYEAYTDLTDSNVVNYFYLQEFTPSQAVELTDEDLKFTEDNVEIVVNEKLESNFSYNSLIKKMEQGYIYRLYCFSNQHNSSGDLIRTTDSTSCFFSLNSWKSNSITVLNIYNLIFPTTPEIEQEGGTITDTTDLENIQNGITDLNNNLTTVPDISGETITSEDITGSFDFDFAEDPYANFWLELTTRTFWCFDQ